MNFNRQVLILTSRNTEGQNYDSIQYPLQELLSLLPLTHFSLLASSILHIVLPFPSLFTKCSTFFFFPLQFLRNFPETCLPRSTTEAKQCFASKVWNTFPWFVYFLKNRQQVALLPLYQSQIASPGTGLGVVRPGVKSGSRASWHWWAFISVVITEWQFDLTQDGYSLSKCFTNININSLQLAMI